MTEPALTPEQWVEMLRDPQWYAYHRDGHAPALPRLGSRHALAAAYLFGQPFGFTQQDVEILRREADIIEQDTPDADDVVRYRNLAARIAALLPPPA